MYSQTSTLAHLIYFLLFYKLDAPFLDVEVTDQMLNEGDTATFTCQSAGIPIPKISWYFNGAPVEKSFTIKYMISEVSLNHATKTSTLTIMNVESSDIGIYTCYAVNFVNTVNSSGVLTVDGKFCISVPYRCV